uniref:Uncharacterized protein n=1 Tax=Prolemur simus TaxID=1328070 RepID=A0A8C9A7F2_PROSS
MIFHCKDLCIEAGLKLLTSSDPPALASQSARITGVSHRARPIVYFLMSIIVLPFFNLCWQFCFVALIFSNGAMIKVIISVI